MQSSCLADALLANQIALFCNERTRLPLDGAVHAVIMLIM